MRTIELSIIVPLFNEEECVELLFKKINDASLKTNKEYEIIKGNIDILTSHLTGCCPNDKIVLMVSKSSNTL